MFGWVRTYRAGRRLRREWKECVAALEVCSKRDEARRDQYRRRAGGSATAKSSSPPPLELGGVALSSVSGASSGGGFSDNEADAEDGDDDDDMLRSPGPNRGDGAASSRYSHGISSPEISTDASASGGGKTSSYSHRDNPRLDADFAGKLRLFLSDLRSSCESISSPSGATEPATFVSETAAVGTFAVPGGTLDRAYGGDLNEVIIGLLDACMLGTNAERLSTSRRSLAKRASMIAQVPDEASLDSSVVHECLVFLEVILREQKYQTFVTASKGSTESDTNESADKAAGSSNQTLTARAASLRLRFSASAAALFAPWWSAPWLHSNASISSTSRAARAPFSAPAAAFCALALSPRVSSLYPRFLGIFFRGYFTVPSFILYGDLDWSPARYCTVLYHPRYHHFA